MFKLYIKDSFSLIKGDGFNQIETVEVLWQFYRVFIPGHSDNVFILQGCSKLYCLDNVLQDVQTWSFIQCFILQESFNLYDLDNLFLQGFQALQYK